jgi:hypothetical protein
VTPWAAAPPLDPTREQARDLALRELSDPAYARARPGLVERAVTWVFDRVNDLGIRSSDLTSPAAGVALLVLVAVVVLTVVLLRTGRLRGPGRAGPGRAVFAEQVRTAAEYRLLADQAAEAGRWAAAVQERYRAVVRALEERVVLDERPGRTAHEAAAEAGDRLPAVAVALVDAAKTFDDVVYGERVAVRGDDQDLRALDDAVQRSRPGSTRTVTEQSAAALPHAAEPTAAQPNAAAGPR